MLTGCKEWSVIKLLLYLSTRILFWLVEKVNDFLRCFLNSVYQTHSLVFSVAYELGDLTSEESILWAGLWKIGDIFPQLLTILKVNKELSKIRMWTGGRVTQQFSRSIVHQLHIHRCITTLCERYCFRVREENVVTLCQKVLSYKDVKDIKCDLIEQVSHNLKNQRCTVVIWWKSPNVLWKLEFL